MNFLTFLLDTAADGAGNAAGDAGDRKSVV